MPTTELWAEYGLIGLVVCALFSLVFFLLHQASQDRKAYTDSINGIKDALKDLTNAIHNQR